MIQTERVWNKGKRIPMRSQHTNHQVKSTLHWSTRSGDKKSPKLNSIKISYATTNTLLTSNNDQDIHPDDQHGWSLHRAHVDPNTTRVDHPSRQIHIAVRLQQPRQQWRKLAREPEAWNRALRPEGTDWAPFQKDPCQTSQSFKGFKHKRNQRRAQKIKAQHDSSKPVAKPLKMMQNPENLNKTFLFPGSHIELKHFLAAGHQSDLNQRTEHEVQCRLSAEFVQRQRVLPLMPLVTAAIGCAINNPIAPKSSVSGKPMRHCACKNNE